MVQRRGGKGEGKKFSSMANLCLFKFVCDSIKNIFSILFLFFLLLFCRSLQDFVDAAVEITDYDFGDSMAAGE